MRNSYQYEHLSHSASELADEEILEMCQDISEQLKTNEVSRQREVLEKVLTRFAFEINYRLDKFKMDNENAIR